MMAVDDMAKIASILFIIFVTFFSNAYASDEYIGPLDYGDLRQEKAVPPNPIRMSADLLLARPLLIGATAVGTVFFVVSLPFSLLGGNVGESAEHLIGTPLNAAFSRCLGCTS